jgi:hypothetical protein
MEKSMRSMKLPLNQRLAGLLTKKFSRFFHAGFNEGQQKSMKNSPPGFESMVYCVKVSKVSAHWARIHYFMSIVLDAEKMFLS